MKSFLSKESILYEYQFGFRLNHYHTCTITCNILLSPIRIDCFMSQKIQNKQSDCTSITPVWKRRPWYPILLSMIPHLPLLLPQPHHLLQLQDTNKIHEFCIHKTFRLAAQKISGKSCKVKAFLKRCPR